MDDNKKDPQSSSLLADIFKDTYKQVIVPKFKEIVNNFATDAIYMFSDYLSRVVGKRIFGPDSNIPTKRSNGRTNYSGAYQSSNSQQQPNIGMRQSTDLQYVVAESHEQAEAWKNDLIYSIRKFGRATVSQLYEKTDGRVKPLFNDFDYGWTNEADIHYVRNQDGYWFNLPKPTKVK